MRRRVLSLIDEIVERKRKARIVPSRATWRELRDCLSNEELEELDKLVAEGEVERHRGLRYDSYNVADAQGE